LSLVSTISLLLPFIKAQDIGVNAVNLVGWEGCSAPLKKKIVDLWEDAVKIGNSFMDTKIDWNQAAALENLGPLGFNEEVQSQIKNVLENVATFGQGSWF
jgi:hypothetical protein